MVHAIWIERIEPHSKRILLRTFYRPPDGSYFLDVEFMSSFENILEVANAEKKDVIIMADLRANVCNFRESVDSREFLNFFIFRLNNLYSTLISKITLKLETAFHFFRNQQSLKNSKSALFRV